jgi:ribosomal protein S18 acetylase RimI-like enzyme
MTAPIIKNAILSDESNMIDVIVLAFSTDPGARWTWPDPHQYLLHFPELVKAFGGKAFENKSGYYAEGYGGAALWLPPNVHPNENAMTVLIERTAPTKIQKEITRVFEKMENYHPKEPHWYLPLIGVDPFLQGNGIGSALMKHALVACDRENKFAFLESTNLRNVPLYERHGFEVLGNIQVGTSPNLYPMIRSPRSL